MVPLLNHRITKGYGPQTYAVVTRVNGTAVHNLSHLVTLLRDAKGEYLDARSWRTLRDAPFRRRTGTSRKSWPTKTSAAKAPKTC